VTKDVVSGAVYRLLLLLAIASLFVSEPYGSIIFVTDLKANATIIATLNFHLDIIWEQLTKLTA
jgi:hypothetical protein